MQSWWKSDITPGGFCVTVEQCDVSIAIHLLFSDPRGLIACLVKIQHKPRGSLLEG